jgi:hypothetical protein
MSDQMALLPTPAAQPAASDQRAGGSWELDEHTREAGRRGIAEARQALRHASAPLAA